MPCNAATCKNRWNAANAAAELAPARKRHELARRNADHRFADLGKCFDLVFGAGAQPNGVGAGFAAGGDAVDAFLQRVFGFRARDDDQILIAPRVERGFDFVDELFARNQADVETFVAGAFGRHLIFDMERGDAGFLELAHVRG